MFQQKNAEVLVATVFHCVARRRLPPFLLEYKQECGENEEWTNCGSVCQPSCGKPSFNVCTSRCFMGCKCKDGFYRDSLGKCIADCSSERCVFSNEVRKKCGVRSICQPTCLDSPSDDFLRENCNEAKCVPFECECKPGYIRMGGQDEHCIPLATCEKLRRR
ncbi:hypothetical protein Y032_0042g554 [Ancylostoma ceylanicum]|uniref:TIL domain-containing protein n=1 Tax=Ancylostoma ceylanicum TaxID=53326 RepID=A0A016UG37_9BILA|nr:hypothetical protein Y032_0042g554 [Ancylostoma ceylanicum]